MLPESEFTCLFEHEKVAFLPVLRVSLMERMFHISTYFTYLLIFMFANSSS